MTPSGPSPPRRRQTSLSPSTPEESTERSLSACPGQLPGAACTLKRHTLSWHGSVASSFRGPRDHHGVTLRTPSRRLPPQGGPPGPSSCLIHRTESEGRGFESL